ncbi:unnamed protein product, partial [Gulo gulo]
APQPVAGHVQLLQGRQLQQLPGKSRELVVVHVEGAQAQEAGEGVGQVCQPVEADIQLLQVKWEHICSLLRKINCNVFLAPVGSTFS